MFQVVKPNESADKGNISKGLDQHKGLAAHEEQKVFPHDRQFPAPSNCESSYSDGTSMGVMFRRLAVAVEQGHADKKHHQANTDPSPELFCQHGQVCVTCKNLIKARDNGS